MRTAMALAALSIAAARAQSPTIAGCGVFPVDNIWNTRVDTLPRDAKSAAYVTTIGADKPLVPDFGSGVYQGGPIGIPFTIVSRDQPRVPVQFQYGDESDPGPYPIPPGAPIEGGAQSSGDRHVLVLDRDACVLYELFSAYPQSDGSWKAGSGAVFDLKSNKLRPATWTSADAAGFAIVPGLVRYDEIAAGAIRHAIRFTVPQTRREYVWPATHFASRLTGAEYPPMGQRFRLRADFDIAGFSPANQVILRALKTYGMLLADNGSSWFISGAPDERWNNEQLRELRKVRGSDFEAVDTSSLQISADSGAARQAPSPVANAFSTVPTAVSPGEIITISGPEIGPKTASAFRVTDGVLDTQLSGTSVTFGGAASPLLYVSRDRVTAIVPYGVAGTLESELVVTVDGSPTYRATVPVANAAPALMTSAGSGSGLVFAMNQDNLPNSLFLPAPRGSEVTLYGTGEGLLDPALPDGLITGDTPSQPVLPVAARISGLPADVIATGTLPGAPAGVFQVKVRVPDLAASGKAAVLLAFGAWVTQADVYLYVE